MMLRTKLKWRLRKQPGKSCEETQPRIVLNANVTSHQPQQLSAASFYRSAAPKAMRRPHSGAVIFTSRPLVQIGRSVESLTYRQENDGVGRNKKIMDWKCENNWEKRNYENSVGPIGITMSRTNQVSQLLKNPNTVRQWVLIVAFLSIAFNGNRAGITNNTLISRWCQSMPNIEWNHNTSCSRWSAVGALALNVSNNALYYDDPSALDSSNSYWPSSYNQDSRWY